MTPTIKAMLKWLIEISRSPIRRRDEVDRESVEDIKKIIEDMKCCGNCQNSITSKDELSDTCVYSSKIVSSNEVCKYWQFDKTTSEERKEE